MNDGEPGANPTFWAIRNSLLPATLDMDRAADLLDAAADLILADRSEEAVTLIQQADIITLFDIREQASRAPPLFSVHRVRETANLLARIPKEHRAPPFKSESTLGEAVFRRDGWRCRYCGCRIIPSRVRRWVNKFLPGTVRWNNAKNLECHAGFWTLWGSVDHVIPRARGGCNKAHNLVTACMVCNFAKEDYTLEQLGLADPRCRAPVLGDWDGLTRLTADVPRAFLLVPKRLRPLLHRPNYEPAKVEVLVSEQRETRRRTVSMTSTEYYARLEAHLLGLSQPFETFVKSLCDVGVVAEVVRSVVLRFPLGNGEHASAGSILTSGRVYCADAYHYAQKYGKRDVGERYLAAIAALTDGKVRSAGRLVPEVFGVNGRQINVDALLPNSMSWRTAIANFVRDMQAAVHG